MNSKKFFALLLVIFIMICFISALPYIKLKEEKDNYYTYAIIFYPDHNTTVEGYVDNFVWRYNSVNVIINGEEYISSPENIVIIKRKDLIVNKEDLNEVNNN